MADGIWVVLGAAVGTVGTLATTWLSAYLNKKSADPFDAAAMKLLRSMLEGKHNWRKITTLANVVGLDEKTTKEYLVVLGARGSETNANLWGLVSRNPLGAVQEDNLNP